MAACCLHPKTDLRSHPPFGLFVFRHRAAHRHHERHGSIDLLIRPRFRRYRLPRLPPCRSGRAVAGPPHRIMTNWAASTAADPAVPTRVVQRQDGTRRLRPVSVAPCRPGCRLARRSSCRSPGADFALVASFVPRLYMLRTMFSRGTASAALLNIGIVRPHRRLLAIMGNASMQVPRAVSPLLTGYRFMISTDNTVR